MIHIIIKRLLRRKFRLLLFILALLSIFVLIPLGIDNMKNAKLVATESIENVGRGTYDILIRPASSRTPVETVTGKVEENYIGDSKGGISIEEWRNIQADSDIEVAAPVASIGYFTGKKFSIELPATEQTMKYSWTFYTSDGQQHYPISKKRSMIYFKESTPSNLQFLRDLQPGESATGSMMEIMMPPTYYHVAAIDLESEQKLTNLDLSQLENDIDKEELTSIQSNFGNIPIIKVIQREDIQIPIKLQLEISQLNLDITTYHNQLGLSKDDWIMSADETKRAKVLRELEKQQSENTHVYEYDLAKYQHPFNGTALKINEQFQIEAADNFVADRIDVTKYYTSSKIDYDFNGEILSVPIVENGEPPSYKKISVNGKTLLESNEVPYLLEQVGTFSGENIEEDLLTSSPLGIYSLAKNVTADGDELTPTTIPGSFISQPAGGLISIESAELVKGKKPIDAIRVRVANINKYNTDAQQKIERIAVKYLQEGYEVDIVAGSSFQNVQLNVEGIGLVNGPWTTLGVAQDLEETWNGLNIITTILFCLFAIVWYVTRLVFERNSLQPENELLLMIGWSENQIMKRNKLEQVLLIVAAYLLSIPLINFLSLDNSAYIYTTIFLLITIICVSVLVKPLSTAKTNVIVPKHYSSTMYYKHLIIPAMLILILSSILLSLKVASLGSAFEEAEVTSLGQFVMNETSWYQYFVMFVTFILTLIAIAESVHALLSARKEELNIFNIIGWTKERGFRHLLKESLLWIGPALIIGMFVSFIIEYIFKINLLWSLIGTISTAVLLGFIMICILYFAFHKFYKMN